MNILVFPDLGGNRIEARFDTDTIHLSILGRHEVKFEWDCTYNDFAHFMEIVSAFLARVWTRHIPEQLRRTAEDDIDVRRVLG